jgi:hypothetical protein
MFNRFACLMFDRFACLERAFQTFRTYQTLPTGAISEQLCLPK